MTLQEAKEIVAKEYGYSTWESLRFSHSMSFGKHDEYMDKVSELYAKDSRTRALDKVTRIVTDEQSKTIDRVLSVPQNLPISQLVEGKITTRQFVDYLEKELKAAMRV